MKPPPDVDNLMWLLAEEQNEVAIAEFEERYPRLGPELARRMAMVRGLREGRNRLPSREVIPPFVPPPPPRSLPRSAVLALGLALAGAAAASFTFTWSTLRKESEIGHATPIVNAPVLEYEPKLPPKETAAPEPEPEPLPKEEPLPKYLVPVTMRLKRTPLINALQLVGAQTGLELEIAPGMPNPDVELDYEGMTGIEILQDLGKQYAFTPLEQEEGKVLIIPAVEGNPSDDEESPVVIDPYRPRER